MCTDEDRARMIRIESRLCQLMQHMGLDPHIHKYDAPQLHDDLEDQKPDPLTGKNRGVWKQRDPK